MSTLTYRDAVAHLFKSRVGEWVDGLEIAQVGGMYGWRTRVSDCRTQLGMDIVNDVRRLPSGRKVSRYRYVPSNLLEMAS